MRRALLLMTALCLGGGANAQEPAPESEEAGLRMQVTRLENDIRMSPARLTDPALTGYVQNVLCRVAAGDCTALRFYILRAPGFGIASLPNGAMIVSSGALLRVQTEDQLAHVLAHDVSHYQNRDSLKQFNRLLTTSGAAALFGVAAAGVGVDFVGTGASMAALSARYSHSQNDERAADARGVGLAADAGYNPLEGADLWDQIDQEAAVGNRRDVYARVHPTTPERHALLAAAAHTAKRAAPFASLQSWSDVTAPWLPDWIDDELRRGQANANVKLFTRLGATQPSRGLYRYALGEAYRKRAAPGDAALALASFRAALVTPDAPPPAWRGLGLAAMQEGDKNLARSAFAHYRALLPDAEDKAMIDYYLAQP